MPTRSASWRWRAEMPPVPNSPLNTTDKLIARVLSNSGASATLTEDSKDRFEYLRPRFVSFTALRNAVALLRGAEIESERHRRPTSRHLAPRGIDMLTADYGESKNDNVNKDRRFFARGGELLYVML